MKFNFNKLEDYLRGLRAMHLSLHVTPSGISQKNTPTAQMKFRIQNSCLTKKLRVFTMVSSSMPTSTPSDLTTELAECGWRTELVTQPDGTIATLQVPLTASEFLHPQEGYQLPNSTFHDKRVADGGVLMSGNPRQLTAVC